MTALYSQSLDEGTIVDRLIGPAAPEAAFGTYVVISTDLAAALGRRLERQVFGDVFGNSEELLAAEYDRYESSSLFIVVVDHRRRVAAGMMRLVLPSPAGLKSLEDIRLLWGHRPDDLIRGAGFDPGSCLTWDLATLAVGRDYRGAGTRGLVSLALWQAVGVMADRAGVDLLVAIIDVRVYRLLQLKLGRAFHAFEEARPQRYLDSPASLPVWCAFARWRARIAEEDPAMYAVMIDGTGLESAIAPPDWAAAAADARRASSPAAERR